MKPETLGPLFAAHAKIKRAKSHIDDLDSAVADFINSRPYDVVSEIDPNNAFEVLSFCLKPVPTGIDCIAADAIHNLRAPLDKMLTALADREAPESKRGGRHPGVQFPTGVTKEAFERAVSSQKKHFSEPVTKWLENTEAYVGGAHELLFALHDMDIDDKHYPLLVPVRLGTVAVQVGEVKGYGRVLTIGSRRGAHMRYSPVDNAFIAPSDDARPVLREMGLPGLGKRRFLEFTSAPNDMEFMTITPGTQVKYDVKPSINVAFGQVKVLEGEPVSSALLQIHEIVEGLLLNFEKRFFT